MLQFPNLHNGFPISRQIRGSRPRNVEVRMNLTPPCTIVPNIPLKTRRRTSSEWLRRYSILHLCRYQYQHLPGI